MVSRTVRTPFGDWWWTVDRAVLAAMFGLMLGGIILSLAASPPVAARLGLDPFHFVNRQGRTAPAFPFDNGADNVVEGLARTVKAGKVGFVNPALDVVVPPVWDFAYPFEKGAAPPGLLQKLGMMAYWRATHTRPDVCSAKGPPPFCGMI